MNLRRYIKNKPIQLADGTIVCPSSVEKGPRGKEWEVWMETTADDGQGLTLVHFSPQPVPFLTQQHTLNTP